MFFDLLVICQFKMQVQMNWLFVSIRLKDK